MKRPLLFGLAGLLLLLCLSWFLTRPVLSPPDSAADSAAAGHSGARSVRNTPPPPSGALGTAHSVAAALSLGRQGDTSAAPKKRPWERNFLPRFLGSRIGDAITFELVSGEIASGQLGYIGTTNAEVIYLSGKLTLPEPGRFFFE